MKNIHQTKSTRSISWILLFTFIWGTFSPSITFAGGPTQPEVHGFTPISVSDMVDPFTGDFSYNIPIMDVEGYPINISYASGVSMDQEASWVGLGWSLNTGAIVRNMRGLPDDFSGDIVEKTISQKPNVNIDANIGATIELFGKKKGVEKNDTLDSGASLKLGIGASFSNYSGVGVSLSFGPSFTFAKLLGGKLSGGFSLSGSSENGAGFNPNLSFTSNRSRNEAFEKSKSYSVGTAFNSRAGLQQITYGYETSRQSVKYKKNECDEIEKSVGNKEYGGLSGTFDMGLNSYSPQAGPSMFSQSISGIVSGTITGWGVDAQGNIGVTYSQQWIPDFMKTIKSPSYGYFNSQNGESNTSSLLDFNRDNDGSFTKYSRDLPSAYQTYDLFSIQAQGVGGSFRGFRNDVSYVFDAETVSLSQSNSFGLELGLGGLSDFSGDFSLNNTESRSGLWSNKNTVLDDLNTQNNPASIVPNFSMIDASEAAVETDALIPTKFLNTTPVQFDIENVNPRRAKLNNTLVQGTDYLPASGINVTQNKRSSRIPTNKQLYFLSNTEVAEGLGIQVIHPNIYPDYKSHHIGEITQLGTDGRRYIFGLPAYNHFQEDVTFAIGDELYDNLGIDPKKDDENQNTDDFTGLVHLTPDQFTDFVSINNKRGIDHYFSKTITPAYAHAYMLTSVLSDDYIDADEIQGPSENDMGSYVKFDYNKVEDFAWRTPMQENKVYYNEGMKTDQKDDKASFVYGKKELYYLKKIETKNYIAIFKAVPRLDGYSAASDKGGFDGSKSQCALESITLYSKADYYDANGQINPNATPLQKVEFKYNYKSCQNYPANLGFSVPVNTNCFSGNEGGKLTLTDIYFSYQGSNKMKVRNYHFDYSDINPSYNLKATDRWGVYKANNSNGNEFDEALNSTMTNGDWPYAVQDKTIADQNASAWALTQIKLPSGGTIKVDYESDDYAFVQHLPAAKMFKIVAVQLDNAAIPLGIASGAQFANISKDDIGLAEKNKDIYFKMDNPNDNIEEYVQAEQQLYFRCLMDFNPDVGGGSRRKCEMVSGYATVANVQKLTLQDGSVVGRIKLKGEKLKDGNDPDYNPITKAAILFGRLHLPRTITDIDNLEEEPSGSTQLLADVGSALVGSLTSFGENITGPNKAVYNLDKGVDLVLNKSFIRLTDPSKHKLGGGSRVHQIRMYDNWNAMTNNEASDFYYGQQFEYTLEDGTSSGVASYEPQLGGDENPWHKAYEVNQKKRFALDDKLFIEDPIMESQFPNPSVGYSRVVIKDLEREGVQRTATGKVVKEFYTARDFPTIVNRTKIETRPKNSLLPLLPKYQYLVASQGFTIELNDMHGKPKKESVYAQGKDAPISTVDYLYQQEGLYLDGYTNFKLNNDVKVIQENGQLADAKIGIRYDAVADFRESTTSSKGVTIQINTNSFLLGFIPVVVPTIWPKIESTTNTFRSSTMNKTVNRFGILKETRANQDGSIVSTNNLAYDSRTGEVLSTQTTTNFDDKVYSMNYPAYWEYPSFGQASKNVMYEFKAVGINTNGYMAVPSEDNYFFEGDEVEVLTYSNLLYNGTPSYNKGWVVEKNTSGIRIIDKEGNPISGLFVKVKVIRSGYKNKQSTSMASVTSLSDPTVALVNNNYKNVLNAGAVEFGDSWNTYCDCYKDGNATTNPFILGTRGNWRPIRSFTHLSGRTQNNYNGNTNIRKDGVFTSYTPFYTNVGGNWSKNGSNWTFVSEVTQFSPNGMTLETRDALGRYSASTFGFNNTLTTGVAANTKSTQLAVGNFEDIDYTNCMDQGFFGKEIVAGVEQPIAPSKISKSEAHSGRTSIKVAAGTSVQFGNSSLCAEEKNCSITSNLVATIGNGNSGIVTISGGTPAYQIEIDSPLETEAYLINGNQLFYSFQNIKNQTMITVKVIDSQGCVHIFEIKRKNPLTPGGNYELIVIQ